MSQIKLRAQAIKNGTDNERRYDRDLVDILSEEVVGIFNPLIADHDLRRLVLADAYAKECVMNHGTGNPSKDLDESTVIVEEMMIDLIFGSDPEYREIFDVDDEDGDEDPEDIGEDDPEDSFRSCVERYLKHLMHRCVYDEELECIGCGLCAFGYLPGTDDDPDGDDTFDDLGYDVGDDDPCSGSCACHGCGRKCPHDQDTIPRFEVVEDRLTITFVGRDGDA